MKRRLFVSLTLCACIACSFLTAACGRKDNPEPEPETPKAARQVVLEDFETDDYMFYVNKEETQISYEGGFIANKAASEHLTDGRSLEIAIRKYVSESWAGYAEDTGLCAITDFDVFSTPKNNGNWGFEWKYLTELSLDAYNPNEFPVRISIYNLTRNGFPINFGTTTLESGETAKVTANVNRYYMQNEFNDKISHILVAINYDKVVKDNGELYYPEAKVYLDNLVATVNENDVKKKDGSFAIDKKFASDNEILNFDDAGDLSYVRETGGNYVKDADNEWITTYWYCGTGSSYYYNSDPKYVYDGNKGSAEWRVTPVLQVNMTGSNYDWNTRFSFDDSHRLTGLTLEGAYLDYLNFARVKGDNVKIRLDIYNGAPYDKEIFFGIHDTRGVATEVKTEFPFMYGTSAMTDKCYRLKAGEWNTVEIDDFSHLDLAEGLARLRVMTTLADVTEEFSFYLNNLRFVEGDDVRTVAETVNAPEIEIRAPKIYTSENFAVVGTGETRALPEVKFSQDGVTAKYYLDGEEIAADSTVPTDTAGIKTLVIKATNGAGKTSAKTVKYYVTEKETDLNKLYALDNAAGLEFHAGKAAMGLNGLRLTLVDGSDEANLKKDVFGNVIRPIDGENSYVFFTNYTTLGRFVLTNPLFRDIDKKFDSLYFWFYNGGEATVTVSFNNHAVEVKPKTGWQKIEITDFEEITSLGKAANVTAMIDAGDMVGSFIKINTSMPFEKYAISAIYGTPKPVEGGIE